jgi:predicted nucleic acid-binding protein
LRIWVIDTASIIELRRGVPTRVLHTVLVELDTRAIDGAIVYPPEVIEELERGSAPIKKKERPDLPFEWAKRHEALATRHGRLYSEAREILRRVPGLVDHTRVAVGNVDEADPYVVALAVRLKADGHEVRVITEDFNSKPRKMALADAAGVFLVPCVTMRTFLVTEGIWDGEEGL